MYFFAKHDTSTIKLSLVSHTVWPYTGSDVIRIPTMTSRDVIRTSTMMSIVWVWVCDTSLEFEYQRNGRYSMKYGVRSNHCLAQHIKVCVLLVA